MGILANLDRSIRAETHSQDGRWISDHVLSSGVESDSGIRVTERNGIGISTIWKCVNWRANQIGMLSKKVWERVEMLGRMAQRAAPQHPLYRIVHTNPNPTMAAKCYFGLVSADLHLWGNSYAIIERGENTGRLRNIWRLQPHYVRIDTTGGALRYFVTTDNGHEEPFLPDEILHIPGLGYDGIRGYSPIRINMQTLGWNAAAQRYGAQFFKNASRPSFLAIAPAAIKDKDARAALVRSLTMAGKHAGEGLLIEGALDIKPLQMHQDEAQFVETMQFQEEDIAGIMGVPQHKIQILRRSTNNNIEHQGIEAVTDSLQPVCVDIEQSLNLQLLSDFPSSGRGGGTERDRFFVECDLKTLMRGDTAAQTAHIATMIDKGVYSQNDGRDYLGLPPVDGGDEYWVNMAYVPISMAKEILTKETEPEPEEEDPQETPEDRLQRELQARVKVCYARIVRDAVGRVIARKNGDRQKFTSGAFRHILVSLAEGLSVKTDDEFVDRYLIALGQRATEWDEAQADEIATAELERAVKALLEKPSAV